MTNTLYLNNKSNADVALYKVHLFSVPDCHEKATPSQGNTQVYPGHQENTTIVSFITSHIRSGQIVRVGGYAGAVFLPHVRRIRLQKRCSRSKQKSSLHVMVSVIAKKEVTGRRRRRLLTIIDDAIPDAVLHVGEERSLSTVSTGSSFGNFHAMHTSPLD
ncbi:hypothetical protein GMOD_00004521 [Pyrenophora seminiperda CCB06]|uniref:Uncharacterized protein n=1 Tax=Pyrenophora seminiperda CCB06 TaxID=1302712 RepID=A0A3M7M1I3_9PLEO|nr:hypothetical protein GMOD_00004521 [Pyrenophora seminiperda CCB06]